MPYPVAAVRNKNFGGQYADAVLGLSPLAYWPLGEASGTAALDLVGAHNGAYTGVTLAQSQPPFSAPSFDGSADYCNIYSTWLNTQKAVLSLGSLALWAKVSAAGVWTDGAIRRAFSIIATGANDFIVIGRIATDSTLQFTQKTGGTQKNVTVGSLSSTGWLHLAMTWTVAGNEQKAYIGGAQVGTTQTGLGTQTAADLLAAYCHIGAEVTDPTRVWSGWLAHVALWNRVLSATEVANLYNWGL